MFCCCCRCYCSIIRSTYRASCDRRSYCCSCRYHCSCCCCRRCCCLMLLSMLVLMLTSARVVLCIIMNSLHIEFFVIYCLVCMTALIIERASRSYVRQVFSDRGWAAPLWRIPRCPNCSLYAILWAFFAKLGCSFLLSFLSVPKMTPRCPKKATRWPQDGTKMAPRWP